MKPHLKYKNIKKECLDISEQLMATKPWKVEDQGENQVVFEAWLARASEIYGVEQPTLIVASDNPLVDVMVATYDPHQQMLVMRKHSVLSLFFTFRLHCVHTWSVAEGAEINEEVLRGWVQDAMGWACSLFYQLRPFLFRRSVREGKIPAVHPRDLLANPEEYEETEQGQVDAVFNEIIQNGFLEGDSE